MSSYGGECTHQHLMQYAYYQNKGLSSMYTNAQVNMHQKPYETVHQFGLHTGTCSYIGQSVTLPWPYS